MSGIKWIPALKIVDRNTGVILGYCELSDISNGGKIDLSNYAEKSSVANDVYRSNDAVDVVHDYGNGDFLPLFTIKSADSNEAGVMPAKHFSKVENLPENTKEYIDNNIGRVQELIPAQATVSNKLADKDFVNSSIATNTAEFKGTHNSLSELQSVTADANDYGYVIAKDEAGNTVYNRYKYVEGEGWKFEYALNNSSFTAEQWESIQSGVTKTSVEKVNRLTGLWVSKIEQNGGSIQTTFKSFYDGAETTKGIDFVTINRQSIFRQADLQLATKNELDVIETLAETINQGLGELEVEVETLQKNVDYKNGYNFVIELEGVPTDKRLVICELAEEENTLSLDKDIESGKELTIIVNNVGTGSINIAIPEKYTANNQKKQFNVGVGYMLQIRLIKVNARYYCLTTEQNR